MRILEILNHPPGETFIQQHAIALNTHASDIELCWAFTQTNQNGRLKQYDFNSTRCYAWPNYNLYPKWKQILVKANYLGKSLNALYKPQLNLLKQIRPDLVHFHFSSLAVKYAHLCNELNIPYTFSIRGSDIHTLTSTNPENQVYIKNLIAVSNAAKAIHAVSNQLRDSFLEITKCKNTPIVIRTTVDDSWQKINRNPVKGLLVAIGRLTWQKGFPDLILAMKSLINIHNSAKLVIIGEGPQRQELEFMIRDLELSQHVELIGKLGHEEIKHWLSKGHAFVLSSVAEGFPNVLAEAMLGGVPVITSNCGGISEIIENNKHALMYDATKSEQLTEMLSLILKTTDTEYLVAQAKEQAIQHFSPQTHASAFKQLWQ